MMAFRLECSKGGPRGPRLWPGWSDSIAPWTRANSLEQSRIRDSTAVLGLPLDFD
jgi:hypothetical protein